MFGCWLVGLWSTDRSHASSMNSNMKLDKSWIWLVVGSRYPPKSTC